MAPRRDTLTRAVLDALERSTLTNRQIATEMGVSEATASRWLHGQMVPSPKHVAKLAELLGVNETEIALFDAGYAVGVADARIAILEADVSRLRGELRALGTVVRRLTGEVLDDEAELPVGATRADQASE